MPQTRIILTRHGETEWNAAHRIQGRTDIPLNDTGIAQAEALAEALLDYGITVICSSDLTRSSHTAGIVHAGIPAAREIYSKLLRERNWGVLEGKNWEEIEAGFPDDAKRIRSGSPDYAPEDGESKNQVLERADEFLAKAIDEFAGETMLAVTHGGVGTVMVRRILGLDLVGRPPFRIENCSINILDYTDDCKWCLETLNYTGHLTARGLV